MKPFLALAMLLSLTAAGPMAHAQAAPPAAVRAPSPFDDVPLTDPAYHLLEVMQDAGVVTGYFNTGTSSGKPTMTRYEFAVALARLLPALLYAPSGGKSDTGLAQAHADLIAKLTQHQDAALAFSHLLTEFQPYVNRLMDARAKTSTPESQSVMAAQEALGLMGGGPRRTFMSNGLDSISRINLARTSAPAARNTPFPDVPKDHWAYQSVETLRRAGIVHGYPATPPASK